MSWYYYAIDEENKIKYCLDKDINAKKLLPFLLYTIDDKPITLLCDEMYEELDKYSDYETNDFLQTSKSFKDYNDDVIDYCELSYADFYDIFNAVKGKYVDISNYIRYSYGLVYMNYMNEGKVWLYNRKSLHIKYLDVKHQKWKMDYYLINKYHHKAYYFKDIYHLKRYLPFVCYLERYNQVFLFENDLSNKDWNSIYSECIQTKIYDIIICDTNLRLNPNYMEDAINSSELSDPELSWILFKNIGTKLDGPENYLSVKYSDVYPRLNWLFVTEIMKCNTKFGRIVKFLKEWFKDINVNDIIDNEGYLSGYHIILHIPQVFSLVKDMSSHAELILTLTGPDMKLINIELIDF